MSDKNLLKSINDIDDDLIFEAESFKSSKAKKPMRLKVAIAAAAAILVVGLGGVAAGSISKANVATADKPDFEEIVVKSGKYYLNGDVSSGLWVEVTPETISLKGDDIDTSMREAIAVFYETRNFPLDEAIMQQDLVRHKHHYCDEKSYFAYVWLDGSDSYRCMIRCDPTISSAGFRYDDITNKIRLTLFGDFILVE